MSRPVVALCRWQDFNYAQRSAASVAYDKDAPLWTDYGLNEPPTACRASLADKLLTVWLPRGAVIRSRAVQYFARRPGGAMAGEYVYVYGSHDRLGRARIRITLTEYPTNGN